MLFLLTFRYLRNSLNKLTLFIRMNSKFSHAIEKINVKKIERINILENKYVVSKIFEN